MRLTFLLATLGRERRWTYRRTPVPGTGARPWRGHFRHFSTVGERRAAGSLLLDEEACDHRLRPRAARHGSALADPWDDPYDGAPRSRRGRGWKANRATQYR